MKKVKAATLIETLTAATILSIVAGLGIMVFLRLSTPASNGAMLLEAEYQTYVQTGSGIFCEEGERDEVRAEGKLQYEEVWTAKGEGLKAYVATVLDAEGNIIYTRKRLYYVR